MPRKLLPALVLCLVLFSAAAAQADGDIYVGGPWGTRITSLPCEIKTPGSYYLGGNLLYAGTSNAITISSDNVTLDLMGFKLERTGAIVPHGIYMTGRTNVEIRNGTLIGWLCGIQESDDSGRLHRIINVRVVNAAILLKGLGHLVKGCEVTTGQAYVPIDIKTGTVSGCTLKFVNGLGIAISGGIIRDNVLIGTGTGTFHYGISGQGNGVLVKGNKVSGCNVGIACNSGWNIIGNTVDAANGTLGVGLPDNYSNLLDQNTVTGAGTHYSINLTNTKVYQRGTNF